MRRNILLSLMMSALAGVMAVQALAAVSGKHAEVHADPESEPADPPQSVSSGF